MTDEQINIEIAEACGWFYQKSIGQADGRYIPNGLSPDGKYQPLPNYCNDLNAMHEAEETMTLTQRMEFRRNLRRQESRECGYGETICHATARQRAEAFIHTLNL